jgi:heat shock protein HslJ
MKKRTILWLTISILIIAVTLISACTKTTPTPVPILENTTWVLQSYGQVGNLKSVLEDTEITALFDSTKGQVAGSAGVNPYGSRYELKGNNLSIPGPLVSTMMAGPQPLMDQEKEYLTALQAAESSKIEGDKLTITCSGTVLIFRKK